MQRLSVIGNLSRDRTHYPNGYGAEQLGGAALYISLAAARGGVQAAPVSVIGPDLPDLPVDLHSPGLDLSALLTVAGPSASFRLDYDTDDQLIGMTAAYGVAERLTEHALDHITRHPCDRYHVCCRRPLDVPLVLRSLASSGATFSVDFIVSSAERIVAEAAPWLPYAEVVFTNAAEYRLLEHVVDVGALRTAVITDGPRPARLLRHGQQVLMSMPPAVTPVEVTGAGDTLTGTFLAHRLNGHDDSSALRAAVSAASTHTLAPSHRP
jgi:sugar/nucleoside kinase (ribokinase family)